MWQEMILDKVIDCIRSLGFNLDLVSFVLDALTDREIQIAARTWCDDIRVFLNVFPDRDWEVIGVAWLVIND